MKKIQKYAMVGLSILLVGVILVNLQGPEPPPCEYPECTQPLGGCPEGYYEDIYGNCISPTPPPPGECEKGYVKDINGNCVWPRFSIGGQGRIPVIVLVGLVGLLLLLWRRK